ncbi:hypothetical protein N9R79_08485, partial [Vibrio sp.]|nr:hypothetical protein [Vibrio sp.]
DIANMPVAEANGEDTTISNMPVENGTIAHMPVAEVNGEETTIGHMPVDTNAAAQEFYTVSATDVVLPTTSGTFLVEANNTDFAMVSVHVDRAQALINGVEAEDAQFAYDSNEFDFYSYAYINGASTVELLGGLEVSIEDFNAGSHYIITMENGELVVTEEEAQSSTYIERVVGEKEGSLRLIDVPVSILNPTVGNMPVDGVMPSVDTMPVPELDIDNMPVYGDDVETVTVLAGQADGQHVWVYEPNIPAGTTLEMVDFDADVHVQSLVKSTETAFNNEYYVNIYLEINGVDHKASIMLNGRNNVIFYIDDVANQDDPDHKWLRATNEYSWLTEYTEDNTHGVEDSSFASFEAFKAAMADAQERGLIGKINVENQKHRYDFEDGRAPEAMQGNFYLKFGSSDYDTEDYKGEDLFFINKWYFNIDESAEINIDGAPTLPSKACSLDKTLVNRIMGDDTATYIQAEDVIQGKVHGKYVLANEGTIAADQKLGDVNFCADVDFDGVNFVNIYFEQNGEQYKADIVMHLAGNPIKVSQKIDGQWVADGIGAESMAELKSRFPNASVVTQDQAYSGEGFDGNFFLHLGRGGEETYGDYTIKSWSYSAK